MFAYASQKSNLQKVIVADTVDYNNAKTVAVSFGMPQIYADLTVTALYSNASTYEARNTITITTSIYNQGLRAAGGFYVALTSTDLAAQAKYISLLALGTVTNVTFTYTAPQYSADRTITVTTTADSTGAIVESNESNNTRYCGETITVTV